MVRGEEHGVVPVADMLVQVVEHARQFSIEADVDVLQLQAALSAVMGAFVRGAETHGQQVGDAVLAEVFVRFLVLYIVPLVLLTTPITVLVSIAAMHDT